MSKHYDVVILGASLGALTAAALLARRSWRVLVLGQGYRPAHYSFDGLPLARRLFTFLAGSSPAWTRALGELAQSQSFRRHVVSLDPMLQVLTPRVRLSIPADGALLDREVERELPEVRRVVDDLYVELAQNNAAVDEAFGRDAVWPPGSSGSGARPGASPQVCRTSPSQGARCSPISRASTSTAPSSRPPPPSRAIGAGRSRRSRSPACTGPGRAASASSRAARPIWWTSWSTGCTRTAATRDSATARRTSTPGEGG